MKIAMYALILILVPLLSLSVTFYVFYKLNLDSHILIPENPLKSPLKVSNITSYTFGSLQFYPSMRFNHNNLTFLIEENCNFEKQQRMNDAFDRIENETSGLITFSQSTNNPDITITCNETAETSRSEYFVAGEGGIESAVNTGIFYVIEKGRILLYYTETKNCVKYNIELHELLHVLGFKHSDNRYSIMYPTADCYQVLTDDIINEIDYLYSIKPLPDLAILNITASKHGIYLDFTLEFENQGLTDARGVMLTVSSDGKRIDSFGLNTVGYGEGRTFSVENLVMPFSLKERGTVTFNLSSFDKEISYDNNEESFLFA